MFFTPVTPAGFRRHIYASSARPSATFAPPASSPRGQGTATIEQDEQSFTLSFDVPGVAASNWWWALRATWCACPAPKGHRATACLRTAARHRRQPKCRQARKRGAHAEAGQGGTGQPGDGTGDSLTPCARPAGAAAHQRSAGQTRDKSLKGHRFTNTLRHERGLAGRGVLGECGAADTPVKSGARNSVMPTPYSYQSSNLEPMTSTKPSASSAGTTHRHRSPLSVDPHIATDAAAWSISDRGAIASGTNSDIRARTDQNEAVRSRTFAPPIAALGGHDMQEHVEGPHPVHRQEVQIVLRQDHRVRQAPAGRFGILRGRHQRPGLRSCPSS